MSKEIVKKYIEDFYLPGSDQTVAVKELWDNRYRVNIWQTDPNKIVDSYFIKVTEEEVECTPSLGA